MQNATQTDGREFGPLNHPRSEEWMSYLYNELPRPSKARLQAHLKQCPHCQSQVARWRSSMNGLSAWKLATPRAVSLDVALPVFKWAVAAMVVLGLGGVVGRWSAPAADVEAIRAAIQKPLEASLVAQVREQVQAEVQSDWTAALSGNPELLTTDFRRQLRTQLDQLAMKSAAASTAENQRLLAEFTDSYNAGRQKDQEAFLALLRRKEQQFNANYLNLRSALETVAVVAADKFQRTETELGQLATYAQASFTSDGSDKPFNSVNPSNAKGN